MAAPARVGTRPAFWLAVAGVSLMAPVGMNLLADRAGHIVPGLKTLNDYTTRRNG